MKISRSAVLVLCALLLLPGLAAAEAPPGASVARQWNELLLAAIRRDFARPTVHARNLFHTSIAMWDGFAAYDPGSASYLHQEVVSLPAAALPAARNETISFAAYRVLRARFASSPGAVETFAALDARMDTLAYDKSFEGRSGTSPAALGNRIADSVLAFGSNDGANEANDYANRFYGPINLGLLPAFPGNSTIRYLNRWQPLALNFFVDQSGNPFPLGVPPFLSPEWGAVSAFALGADDRVVNQRGGNDYVVFHDPGPPPQLGGVGDAEYRAGFLQVVEWSGLLDPSDGAMLDISPLSRGSNTLGTNDGRGRDMNPATAAPYVPEVVPAGDYYRVLAEFWADGPDSETPPGHWFVLANYVSDHPAVDPRIGGEGPELDRLEWDVKLYVALGGAMHDAAVSAWGVKGWYDYVRPISAIRAMVDRGQNSDPLQPSYHVDGIPLVPGLVELVTVDSTLLGERHAHLAGLSGENIGKVAFRTWRGPDYITDPDTTMAGVGWILGENWWPYQRASFVTPPFAGYVSGHSTFSRAAAVLLTSFTGSEFFPGGLGEFFAPRNEFLVFEEGPSVDVTLQWATYYDAADECSLSRIYGGIHPPADDIPGRLMGDGIGRDAFTAASALFDPAESMEIVRGRAVAQRAGRHRIKLKGTLSTDPSQAAPALDLSEGLQVDVIYGGTGVAAASFAAEDIRVTRKGRIRAISPDGAVKIRLRPSRKVPGTFAFRLRLDLDAASEISPGTMSVTVTSANVVAGGSIAGCSMENGAKKLLCK